MINIKILKKYCSEDITLIENFNKAINSDETYQCHHKLEVLPNGIILSRKYLIDNNLYFNRPANELILLTKSEHSKLHSNNRSYETKQKMLESAENRPPRIWTEEQKQKLSKSVTGENNGFYGKKHSDEAKQKMSEAHKGRIAWNKDKKTAPLMEDHKLKISESLKGKNTGINNNMYNKHWYTNGIINICCYECPEGFYKGRILSEEHKQKISATLKRK